MGTQEQESPGLSAAQKHGDRESAFSNNTVASNASSGKLISLPAPRSLLSAHGRRLNKWQSKTRAFENNKL